MQKLLVLKDLFIDLISLILNDVTKIRTRLPQIFCNGNHFFTYSCFILHILVADFESFSKHCNNTLFG